MGNDKNAEEFLSSIGIGEAKSEDQENSEEQSRDGKTSRKKKEKEAVKTANLRVLLTSDQKLKFQMLGVSPRKLCESYLAEYLERDDIKEQIKIKIKELK
jgi:hypothetical protein